MLKVINGGNKNKIINTKEGDTILLSLVTGKVEKIVLSDVTKMGIEGFDVNLKSQPLTFYPYSAIIKITKFNPVE